MNPNQMNVAKAMVARHEYLEDARRSRIRAKTERDLTRKAGRRTSFHTHPLSGLLGLGSSGRR